MGWRTVAHAPYATENGKNVKLENKHLYDRITLQLLLQSCEEDRQQFTIKHHTRVETQYQLPAVAGTVKNHKRLRTSWVAERLLVSQERLSSTAIIRETCNNAVHTELTRHGVQYLTYKQPETGNDLQIPAVSPS
jgi:hypothetical protein